MPLYRYACTDCHATFEVLMREGTEPACPACHGRHLEKQLSAFAVGSAAPSARRRPGPAPCGACGDPRGPGACSIN